MRSNVINSARYFYHGALDLKNFLHYRCACSFLERGDRHTWGLHKTGYGNFPYKFGRTIRGHSFSSGANSDPFLKALLLSSDVEFCAELGGTLQAELSLSAAEVLGLVSNKLSKYPSWAVVLPWENRDIEEKFLKYPAGLLRNRLTAGLDDSTLTEAGMIKAVASFEGAMLHCSQFRKIEKSLKLNGFTLSMSPPEVYLLVKGKNPARARWVLGAEGNHRALVLSAMGNRFLFANCRRVVRFSDLAEWPNVVNGLFSREQAQFLFGKFFKGLGSGYSCI